MTKQSNRRHLLILGAPRSGTTLLAAMIGCHDDIGLLVESKRMAFTEIAGKAVVGNKLCVPNQIEFEANWDQRVSRFSKVPLEKYLALPNFKLVLIVRHVNSVTSSIMKRAGKPNDTATLYWRRGIEIMHELKQRFAANTVVITFENMLAHPERHMRRVTDLLALPYQEKMLEGYKHNPYYRNYSGLDLNRAAAPEAAAEPVDFVDKHPGVWKKFLELRAAGEKIMGWLFLFFNFELSDIVELSNII